MIDLNVESLDFSKGGGLVTVVAQDWLSGAVLMIAHADREAILKTIETGEMHYHSRARGLWHKGATSGNFQRVVSLSADCDCDAVLARVIPAGPACHTLSESCFGRAALESDSFSVLDRTIAQRAESLGDAAVQAKPSYTHKLLGSRNLRLKKIGEEAAELITALSDGDNHRIAEEAGDLFYHMLVAMHAAGLELNEIRSVIAKRAEKK